MFENLHLQNKDVLMKLLKVLLYIILGVVGLFLLLGLFATKEYHIERSMVIDAPKSLVYEHARYFKNFDAWSPWTALDPEQKVTITGTDGEVGAKHSWSGNDNVGEGSQTITAISPDRIDILTEFLRPFKSVSPTAYRFESMGNKCKVHWTFEMKAPFPMNGLMMFTDVDKAIGKDFEMGLENLKRITEEMAHRKYKGYEVTEDATFAERTYYGVRSVTDSAAIASVFAKNMTKTLNAFKTSNIVPKGNAAAIYYTWAGGKADMAVGMPADKGLSITGLQAFNLSAGSAYSVDYYGPFAGTMKAHLALEDYFKANNMTMVGPAVEEYVVTGQTEPDTNKWLTKIIYFSESKK